MTKRQVAQFKQNEKTGESTLVAVYPSISMVTEDGFMPKSVQNVCAGRSESLHGTQWRYLNESESRTIETSFKSGFSQKIPSKTLKSKKINLTF